MRKGYVFVLAAVFAAVALVPAATALSEPGPNGNNDFGLCKAYQHGSENKRDKGPFPGLEEKAGDQDGDGDMDADDVAAYCAGVFPGGKDASPGNSGVTGSSNPSPRG